MVEEGEDWQNVEVPTDTEPSTTSPAPTGETQSQIAIATHRLGTLQKYSCFPSPPAPFLRPAPYIL
jgi:hypothetical protein